MTITEFPRATTALRGRAMNIIGELEDDHAGRLFTAMFQIEAETPGTMPEGLLDLIADHRLITVGDGNIVMTCGLSGVENVLWHFFDAHVSAETIDQIVAAAEEEGDDFDGHCPHCTYIESLIVELMGPVYGKAGYLERHSLLSWLEHIILNIPADLEIDVVRSVWEMFGDYEFDPDDVMGLRLAVADCANPALQQILIAETGLTFEPDVDQLR